MLQHLYRTSPSVPASTLAAQLTTHLDQVQGDRLPSDDRTFLLARRI